MTKFGLVTKYNEKTGEATISYVRPDACAKCGACGNQSHNGEIHLRARCAVGNWVKVELPDGRFMSATALAYGLPLAGFLLGLAAGWLLSGGNELWALAGSLMGIGVCLGALWLNERRISGKPEWTPRVTAVYTEKPDAEMIGCGGAQ